MPYVTRELSVVYGSTTVGGAAEVHLDGPVRIRRNYETTTVDFVAVIDDSASAAAHGTAVRALEQAFRTPRQRLRVLLGGVELLDLDPSDGSGYNASASISDLERGWSGRSRFYAVTITAQTPADLSGLNGLRDAQVELVVDRQGVKTVTLAGRYTDVGGTGARAAHDADVATWAGAQLTAIDGSATWELIDRPAEVTDEDDRNCEFRRTYVDRKAVQEGYQESPAGLKVAVISGFHIDAGSGAWAAYSSGISAAVSAALARIDATVTNWELVGADAQNEAGDRFVTWSRVYRELNANQSVGTRDDATLKNATLLIERVRAFPGDSLASVARPVLCQVNYVAWVDKAVSTDLKSTWESKVLPHIANEVRLATGASQIALLEGRPVFAKEENRITANMAWVCLTGGNLLSYRMRVRDQRNGPTYYPTWDGSPWSADRVPAKQVHRRIVTVSKRTVATGPLGLEQAAELAPLRDADAGEFEVEFEDRDTTGSFIGPIGYQIAVLDEVHVQVLRRRA